MREVSSSSSEDNVWRRLPDVSINASRIESSFGHAVDVSRVVDYHLPPWLLQRFADDAVRCNTLIATAREGQAFYSAVLSDV